MLKDVAMLLSVLFFAVIAGALAQALFLGPLSALLLSMSMGIVGATCGKWIRGFI